MVHFPASLAIACLAALIPPPAPPDPAAMSAAQAMLDHHPPTPAMIEGAIEKALESIANGTVSQVYRGERGGARWLSYRDGFVARIRPMIAPHLEEMVARARTCVASGYARNMTAPEIAAVDDFLDTQAGQSFWRVVGPTEDAWSSCIYAPARDHIDIDAALVASGLPRQDQPPLDR